MTSVLQPRINFFTSPHETSSVKAHAAYLKGLRCLFKPRLTIKKLAVGYLVKNKDAFERDEIATAVRLFTRALECDPNYLPVMFKLAECYQALGEYKTAITTFNKIITNLPFRLRRLIAVTYRQIGKCNTALGDMDAAINAYKQASNYALTDPNDYFELVQCYKVKQDYANALTCCFKALIFHKSLQKFTIYNNEFATLKKLLASGDKSLKKTRSFLMYQALDDADKLSTELAQEIVKQELVLIDHEVNFVIAAILNLCLLSLGVAREGVKVDFSNEDFAQQMEAIIGMQQLFKTFIPHNTFANLNLIAEAIHKAIPYKDFTAEELKQNSNKFLMLYIFNSKTKAVCRHIALYVAYVIAMAVIKGLLAVGSVYVYRNSIAHKAHAWCVYASRNNKHLFLIDAVLSPKSGMLVYDLKTFDHRCKMILIYTRLEMKGLLNNLLTDYGIPIPTDE